MVAGLAVRNFTLVVDNFGTSLGNFVTTIGSWAAVVGKFATSVGNFVPMVCNFVAVEFSSAYLNFRRWLSSTSGEALTVIGVDEKPNNIDSQLQISLVTGFFVTNFTYHEWQSNKVAYLLSNYFIILCKKLYYYANTEKLALLATNWYYWVTQWHYEQFSKCEKQHHDNNRKLCNTLGNLQ
jgi:hypothetical protein